MSGEFRIVVPVTETFYDDGPASDLPRTNDIELWRGTEYPSGDAVDALTENLPESGTFPIPSISQIPGRSDYLRRDVGSEILVQRRRAIILLGWKTLVTQVIEVEE